MQDRRKGNADYANFQERGRHMTRDRMRSKLAIFLLAGAALLVFAMPAGAADSPAANEWQFDGNFYIWGPDIEGACETAGTSISI